MKLLNEATSMATSVEVNGSKLIPWKLVKNYVLGSKTGHNGNAMLPKKIEDQRYPPNDFCTARHEHKSSKKKFQTLQKKKKKSWADRAKIGLRRTEPNVSSKRRDSESSTDIDRQNQRLRQEI